MQRTKTTLRAAFLLSLVFTAGCSMRHAKESAIRLAANALRRSVFCLESTVPLTQSTFKPSPFVTSAAALTPPAARSNQPAPIDRRELRIDGTVDAETVTCPIERRRLLGLGLLRTL
jgi:hypothetical protein